MGMLSLAVVVFARLGVLSLTLTECFGILLSKAARVVDTLATEPEFERFRETPGFIAKAAVGYPSDPRAFLRKVASAVDTLATEPEFERFR